MKEVPRRLRRFFREKAQEEVQKFKEKHKRAPSKKELDLIAENIFQQVKKLPRKKIVPRSKRYGKKEEEKRKERRERYKKKEEKKEEEKESRREKIKRIREEREQGGEEEEEKVGKGTKIEGLFEEEEKPEEIKEEGEIGEAEEGDLKLEGIELDEEPEELEEELEELEEDNVEKEHEDGKKVCTNCGCKAGDIVFCPKCGKQFCAHCAEKVEKKGNVLFYTCPKCKGEFSSKM